MQRRIVIGFVEVLVVLTILIVVGALSYPSLSRRTPVTPLTRCSARLHDVATALGMYVHDHDNRYPGPTWAADLQPYLPRHAPLACELDADGRERNDRVSVGYNGLLLHPDGTGVRAAQVLAPAEVGAFAEADPTTTLPWGGVLNGGGLLPTTRAVRLAPRHPEGVPVAFCDGHVLSCPVRGFNPRDGRDVLARGFYLAQTLGFLDNPAGGLGDYPAGTPCPAPIAMGGEYATRPLLRALAAAWREKSHAPCTNLGFLGQFVADGRQANTLWGCGDGLKPAGPAVALARDAVVVIVNKASRIPAHDLTLRSAGEVHVADLTRLRNVFTAGCRHAGPMGETCLYQAYTYDRASGTRRFFARVLGGGTPITIHETAVTVADDAEMVEKIAADPLGIGYCSIVFADPTRVTVLGLRTPDGTVHHLPTLDANSTWPLRRTLYAVCTGQTRTPQGTGIADRLCAPTAPGTRILHAAPLFQGSYLAP